MKLYGLIGRELGHSWSQQYFSEIFRNEGIQNVDYRLFPLKEISELPSLLSKNPDICGLNVTIPYKETVLPYLDQIDPVAEKIGAVNTIKIQDGKLTGYNTDIAGIRGSLAPLLAGRMERAIVLGTGGAAKAVCHVLEEIGIEQLIVSRQNGNGDRTYKDLSEEDIRSHELIINCTPLGMHPNIKGLPPIPYNAIGEQHILFDLVYNPEETIFMKKGLEHGALVENGIDMLKLQAEESWKIWNE